MGADETERFEAVAGDLLDELGYERAFPEPRSELRHRAAEFRDRVGADYAGAGSPCRSAGERRS
jgi:hypothetical protein